MRIEQLQYFEKVYDEKSISKAADRLFVSRPALSIAMTNLEKELGVQLFERHKDGITVTVHGEQIIEPVREVLRNVSLIQDKVAEARNNPKLHILSLSSVASIILPNVLAYLSKKFPNIDIYIEEATYNDLLELVRENQQRKEPVFCIYSVEKNTKKDLLQRLDKMDITTTFLGEDKTYCCCGIEIFSNQKRITYEEYRSQTLIDHNTCREALFNMKDGESLWSRARFTGRYINVSNLEMLKQMIHDNIGVSLLPGIFLYNDERVKSGALRYLEVCDMPPNIIQYYLFIPKRELEPYESFFVKAIKEEFQNFQDEFNKQ